MLFEQINSVQLNPGQMSDATKLVFHRYGDQYFLAEFWNLGSTTGYEFRRSKAEREIARSASAAQDGNTVGWSVETV